MKETLGKLRWSLVPYESLEEVVRVLEFGAAKYSPDNWKTVEPKAYLDAVQRHIVEIMKHGIHARDAESGLHHAAHMTTDALFLVWFALRENADLETPPPPPMFVVQYTNRYGGIRYIHENAGELCRLRTNARRFSTREAAETAASTGHPTDGDAWASTILEVEA